MTSGAGGRPTTTPVLRALVFDFDGLILETEEPLYLAWREVYEAHGVELELEDWARSIGGSDVYDPLEELERRCGARVDRDAVQAARRARRDELLHRLAPCAGVASYLDHAARAGLRLAVASSSETPWVDGHLRRLGLRHHFRALACFDDVGVTKPAPDAYLLALERLGVTPAEAVAFEDSHHGLMAAQAAGLRCVVVPTAMTRHLDFAAADLVVDRLDQEPLATLVERLGFALPGPAPDRGEWGAGTGG
ncbi:MAG TPA: HAD-IA family hydrolase [Acidimicrobiales bacterium]|nr:HAD-IA family hydrolase [Acidimicrobiales bacterium]